MEEDKTVDPREMEKWESATMIMFLANYRYTWTLFVQYVYHSTRVKLHVIFNTRLYLQYNLIGKNYKSLQLSNLINDQSRYFH